MKRPQRRHLSGKTFLRQQLFQEQRGLSNEPSDLPLADRDRAAPGPYLRAAREKEELVAAATPAEQPAWRSLGPSGIPHGQTYGRGQTTVAGRVTAIAVDPNDSAHLLVGAASGGLWQSRDRGRTWTPRADDQPTLSIGALAFSPSDPSSVYAGTGEGNSEYRDLGQGLLASHDGGSTWSLRAREVFAGFGFYRVVVDPRDGNHLIVATTGGAAMSADGGTTWSLLHRGRTWDVSLAYHGDEPEILLAAPDGLFAGKGAGAPTRLPLPGLLTGQNARRERMAVTHVPTDPGQAFAFAASQGHARLWHRAAADRPFVAVNLPSFTVPPYLTDGLSVEQAAYDWYVAAPASADTVYLGAIELVKGKRTGGSWSWSDISSRQRDGDSIHPDQHTMAFDPQDPDVVYAGNDGGIFRSPDAGKTWQPLNDGLAISEVEYLTQRPDEPGWILAGLQDNGTVRREAAATWAQVALGDGGDCGTNTESPDVCFHSYYYMNLERSGHRGDPKTWTDITPPGTDPDTDGFGALFYPPVEVNGDLVVKAGEAVCISTDRGDSWRQVPLPASGGQRSIASALAIPSAQRVLVGTIRGDVFRIDRTGGGWGSATALATPRDGFISDVLAAPGSPDRYWVTISTPGHGQVFRSDDAGETWTDVTSNLPTAPVNAVISDPADPDRVWVACDVGVFESRDAGGGWFVLGTGLPNALAEDLLFYAPDRLLRVGTRSRGVWEVTVN